jgi:exportin-T
MVLEISGEISDQLLKSARSFNPERHSRDGRVRDLVRERDASSLNDAVVGIVQECLTGLGHIKKSSSGDPAEEKTLEEVVDWGLKAFASYIRTSTI